jgi:hypothetical protein
MCACSEVGKVAITIFGSSLGTRPRQRSKAGTFYLCEECMNTPSPEVLARIRELLDLIVTQALQPAR